MVGGKMVTGDVKLSKDAASSPAVLILNSPMCRNRCEYSQDYVLHPASHARDWDSRYETVFPVALA